MSIPRHTFEVSNQDWWKDTGKYRMDQHGEAVASDWISKNRHVLGYSAKTIARDAEEYLGSNVPTCTGIYFLLQADEIVYIGRADNIRNRLEEHPPWKKFDRYWCFGGFPHTAIKGLEGYYISNIRPSLNRRSESYPEYIDRILA